MSLTNAGANLMVAGITGGTVVPFNAANSYVAVGDSATAFAATQTDLQAATNKLRKLVSAAPTVATNVVTFNASFTTAEANYAINEVGVFNAATAGTMLVRTLPVTSTKTSAQTMNVQVTVTFSAVV